MRTILAILFISTNLNAQDFGLTDAQLHIGATCAISSVTTSYVFNKTNDKKRAMLIGFGTGMTVGIIKELNDKNIENKDMLGNIVGSALGCLVVTISF
tara:strand:+ start:71 stop:364 length:294 start_codon:yes stop_codon:yes gene_type:complete